MDIVIGILFMLGLMPFEVTTAAGDGGVFCDNLRLVSATLPNKTSSSSQHYATDAAGQDPDVAYVLALCRGDVNGSACGECVADTLRTLNDQCGVYNGGTYFNGSCTVAYSFQNLLEPSNAEEPFERWNVNNITGDAENVRFIAGLIGELLSETVRTAAGEARRFATGVLDTGRTFPLVRSMAQCTPDLSAGDCLTCLRRLTGMINSTMAVRMGGQMHVIRCYFRYEAYLFYEGQPMVRLTGVAAPPLAPVSPTNTKSKRHKSKLWIIPIVLIPVVVFFCFIIYFGCQRKHRKGKLGLQESRTENLQGEEDLVLGLEGKNPEFSVFDFDRVLEATSNFSEENKLGQGGFGAVYKGQFSDGMDIAVKRLATHSGQGLIEFRNEVKLIAKLQHRNLVRLLGCCSHGEEKILVYEFLPNKSLDFFIFDENKRALLDWYKRLEIIEGIGHGLLYLHKHSRLSVIHRDLKPSNILLDSEMNPKISDFGLARIFSSNSTEGNKTRRVVGTYGYMAPEYASLGLFSIKSDVFSFGVLFLEILSGKRNSGFNHSGDFINLIGFAWSLWGEGRWVELMDETLVSENHSAEMMRCINIALLCVQENAADRPTMSDVVAMLSSKTMVLSEPKHPAYFNVRVANQEQSGVTSVNDLTISVISAR
ncbi:cysteine-rich receptor-like protein kinase 15 [Oryza brachyantha]|uniref:cysteine-rich receptor-like protein kinase 15 n=1 Tax=Oryza brachyantha TaxID=4533 RepID=UPI001ADA9694|nr:cysteine-rich receptor-like protein kinase 15 [Oryza brachyantha]